MASPGRKRGQRRRRLCHPGRHGHRRGVARRRASSRRGRDGGSRGGGDGGGDGCGKRADAGGDCGAGGERGGAGGHSREQRHAEGRGPLPEESQGPQARCPCPGRPPRRCRPGRFRGGVQRGRGDGGGGADARCRGDERGPAVAADGRRGGCAAVWLVTSSDGAFCTSSDRAAATAAAAAAAERDSHRGAGGDAAGATVGGERSLRLLVARCAGERPFRVRCADGWQLRVLFGTASE
mmetsp:Transcript_31871/g.65992  ORF Transcript_31871/g.65992 Transcript_31871/m.65992 type:complete len:237 (+) Transcript_31871:275-985(+)